MKRFWEKVNKTEKCWNWTAFKDWSGYGTFRFENFVWKSHRFSWTLKHGKIPEGMLVCHHCDNPACVRPSHLFLGTNLDNRLDCASKNRCWRGGKPPKFLGEKHPNHILTENNIKEIREAYTGKYGELTAMGKKYGVHRTAIALVIKGKNWKHV